MAGQLPAQQLIIVEFVRFWGRLVNVARHNAGLRDCLFVWCTLARANRDCWLLRWTKALHRVCPTLVGVLGDLTEWPPIQVPKINQVVRVITTQQNRTLFLQNGTYFWLSQPYSLPACSQPCMVCHRSCCAVACNIRMIEIFELETTKGTCCCFRLFAILGTIKYPPLCDYANTYTLLSNTYTISEGQAVGCAQASLLTGPTRDHTGSLCAASLTLRCHSDIHLGIGAIPQQGHQTIQSQSLAR